MLSYSCKDKLAPNINHKTKGRHHESFAKYVTVEAVRDKEVLTLLFIDWNSKRACLDVVKANGMKPMKSFSSSKSVEMALEDINSEVLKAELGAMIDHDFMYDPDASDFTPAYKEKESNTNG